MNDNEIKDIKQQIDQYLKNDIYTIDQYTELEDKYLDVKYSKEHFGKETFKTSIKNNLSNEDYENLHFKLIEFRMNNAAKSLAQDALEELKNSHFYFEIDLSFRLPHHIVTIQDFKSPRLNTTGLNLPKKLIKLNDNLTTDIYLDFAIHINHILFEDCYHVLSYDLISNKFTFKVFTQNNDAKFKSEIQVSRDNQHFYRAYKNGVPISEYS